MNNLKTIFFIALFLVLYSNKNKFFILNENFDNTEFNKLPKMSYVQDIELKRRALRLQHLLDEEEPEVAVESVRTMQVTQDEEYVSGATEEEIYRAQVSHHYFGALR